MTTAGFAGPTSDLFGKLGLADVREIGRGATCTVYVAHDAQLSRRVAVKHFTRPIADEKAERRFLRECQTLAGLQHPNILTLHLNGLDDVGRPYIVMEHCPNGSLADLLTESGSLSVGDVTRIGIKLCSALQLAHDRDVLHRDIKPANVLLTDLGDPKLADFGIAGDPSEMSVTVGDALTPLYAAPEVLEDGGGSRASDVWSLATTIYALLLGRAPYAATGATREGFLALLERIVRDPVPSLDRSDVPAVLENVLAAGMAKDPLRRIPTARDFARALQEAQQSAALPITEYLEAGSSGVLVTEEAGGAVGSTAPSIPGQALFDSGTRTYFATPLTPPRVTASTTTLRPQPVVPVVASPPTKPPRRWPLVATVGGIVLAAAVAVTVIEIHGSGGTPGAASGTTVKTGTIDVSCNGLRCSLQLGGVQPSAGADLNWQVGNYTESVPASTTSLKPPALPGPGKYAVTVTEVSGSTTLLKATSTVTISGIHRSISFAKLSNQAIELLVDSPSNKCSQNQVVSIESRSGTKWRRVRQVRVTGSERLLTLGAGDYRATLPQRSLPSAVCNAVTSRAVHLQGPQTVSAPAVSTAPVYTAPVQTTTTTHTTTTRSNPVSPTGGSTTRHNPVHP